LVLLLNQREIGDLRVALICIKWLFLYVNTYTVQHILWLHLEQGGEF